ncbi:hypothetical protein [Nocardia sp. NPDC059228]|uniref:hypothetical protein n=1 Tax=Nocardia sp. NPDC059228 TaxID=3346777 RepID=UPI0036CDC83A
MAVTAGGCILLVALEACGQSRFAERESGDLPCTATFFDPPFDHVDPCSAEQVAVAAVETVFTYRPSEQADQGSSVKAAAPLLDVGLAARSVTSGTVLTPITGSQWQRWRSLGIAVVASVRLGEDDHLIDTHTTFARVAGVTLHPGDETETILLAAFVRASRPDSSAGWRISALEVRT